MTVKQSKYTLKWRKFNGEELSDESVLFKNYENPHKKTDYLTADSVREMLTNMLKIAGIERKKTKNRYDKGIVIGFRKRFNGILKMNNEVNSNIAEKLMAHKKGLDGHYLKPTREQCFEEFKKAIPELTIDPTERQKVELEKKQKKIDGLEKTEARISKMEQGLEDSKRILEETSRKQSENKELFEGYVTQLLQSPKIFQRPTKEDFIRAGATEEDWEKLLNLLEKTKVLRQIKN